MAARPASSSTPATTSPATHIDNVSLEALDQNSDAIAHAVLTFAETTSSVNGTDKGKGLGKWKDGMEYKGSELHK
jgi:hypothetical protein